jgi:hypothetical protein
VKRVRNFVYSKVLFTIVTTIGIGFDFRSRCTIPFTWRRQIKFPCGAVTESVVYVITEKTRAITAADVSYTYVFISNTPLRNLWEELLA